MVMVISLLDDSFSTEIPFCTTSAGSLDSANLTLFWTSTAAKSGSVEMSNVNFAEYQPLFELLDSI